MIRNETIATITADIIVAGLFIIPIMLGTILFSSIILKIIRSDKRVRRDGKKHVFDWVWNNDQQLWIFPMYEKKDNSNSYKAKFLLNQNEIYAYNELKKLTKEIGLNIFPKVRLLDLVEPKRVETFMYLTGYIQSRHVDFVLMDNNMQIKAIIILDNKKYETTDQVNYELFLDQVLISAGYKVIHTRCITEETLKGI